MAVIAYDNITKIGGIAHVMLPGSSPKNHKEKSRYAENAIITLLRKLKSLGADKKTIKFYLIGGANVLRKKDDNIAKNLAHSIFEIVIQNNLIVNKTHLGGYERRTASLNLARGKITYSIGNSKEQEFYVEKMRRYKGENRYK